MYAGEPKRYKNYSYRLLCFFVNQEQPGATPLTCSEAVFEDALQKTNERCHSLFRGLPASAHYQGPQCFRNETVLPNSSSIRVKYRLALGSERAIATGASWSCSAVTSAVRNGAVWIPLPTTYFGILGCKRNATRVDNGYSHETPTSVLTCTCGSAKPSPNISGHDHAHVTLGPSSDSLWTASVAS